MTDAVPEMVEKVPWGRAATKRFTNDTLKGEEVLKSLGIDMAIYEQWQRRRPAEDEEESGKPTKSLIKVERRDDKYFRPMKPRQPSKKEKELNMRIKVFKKSIDGFKSRNAELQDTIVELRDEIEGDMRQTNKDVRRLMTEHEAMAAPLYPNEQEDRVWRAGDSAEQLRQCLAIELKALEGQEAQLDMTLAEADAEFERLRLYDFVTAPQQDKQRSQLGRIRSATMRETDQARADFDQMKNRLLSDLEQKYTTEVNRIRQGAINDNFQRLPPLVWEMAVENKRVAAEIAIHGRTNEKLRREVDELSVQVNNLLEIDAGDVDKRLYPEIHAPRTKCEPDEDLDLDIPRTRILPF